MIYFMGFKQLANLLANFSNMCSKLSVAQFKDYYSAPTSNSISASLLLPKSTLAL
jgi:hypothetical protein